MPKFFSPPRSGMCNLLKGNSRRKLKVEGNSIKCSFPCISFSNQQHFFLLFGNSRKVKALEKIQEKIFVILENQKRRCGSAKE